ncbi:hypothetical protein B0H14DRAFT_3135932 [Mycena olivaceomarginata]|nr:hypothetical protein B0H14DRAFT_3135932 [Mycena olivaceomarginata]
MWPPHDHGSKPTPTPSPSSLSHCRRCFLFTVPFRRPPSPSPPPSSALRPSPMHKSSVPLGLCHPSCRSPPHLCATTRRSVPIAGPFQLPLPHHQHHPHQPPIQRPPPAWEPHPYPLFRRSPIYLLVSLLPPPAPPPVTTATPAPAPAPAPVVVSKPGAKEASPNPTTLTARNLCLAVWCAEVGGFTASFNVYWDGIKKDKKLFQAYDNYAKTLDPPRC